METFQLTSHSNREELIDVVRRLKPKTAILVHGEKDGYDWISREIRSRFPKTRVILPEVDVEYKMDI